MRKTFIFVLIIALGGVLAHYFQSNSTEIVKYLEEDKVVTSEKLIEKIAVNENSIITQNDQIKVIKRLHEKISGEEYKIFILRDPKESRFQMLLFSNKDRYIGDINFENKYDKSPRYRFETIKGERVLVIKRNIKQDYGSFQDNETWYSIKDNELIKVADYPINGYENKNKFGIPFKFQGEFSRISGDSVVVDYSISYDFDHNIKASINKTYEFKLYNEVQTDSSMFYTQDVITEILNQNLDIIKELSLSRDTDVLDRLISLLEKSQESDVKSKLLKELKNYTYIENKVSITSASLAYGVSMEQSFDIKNIKEGTKSVIINATCYLNGEKNFETDIADILYTTDNIEAGFDFSFEDDSWNLNTKCGGGELRFALGKEKNLFYQVIPKKIRFKKDEPVIIGVIIADDDKNLFPVTLEDKEENIVKKFKDQRVVILKCMYTD